MGKSAKSQWDFGELFPKEQLRRVLTVSELTATVRRLLEQHVGQVWVGGEITNLRAQASGHMYFTLKDATAQLACVLFRSEAVANRALLQDGQKVVLQGDLTVYEARGQYQLLVRAVELQGVGALQLAFERLKQKLQAEGLFDPARKRPLPRFPERIGLVTSPTGAAMRDVLHVVQRRNPALEIILAPCRVQGEGAAPEIAAAIRLLNEFNAVMVGPLGSDHRGAQEAENAAAGRALAGEALAPAGQAGREQSGEAGQAERRSYLDLILVTRGGGSLEDLWAFNEEVVARAIFESELPVVSAVGHEIDFTISDFVADVRAAAPSAAAEIITEGAFASRQFLDEAVQRLVLLARRRTQDGRERLDQLAQRLRRAHPRRELEEKLQYLDEVHESLLRRARQVLREGAVAWQNLRGRLVRLRPATVLTQRRQALHETGRRLRELAGHRLSEQHNAFITIAARLQLLSPENVLARGYSITMDAASGRVLRSAAAVKTGQKLRTKLKQGEVVSRAEAPAIPGEAE